MPRLSFKRSPQSFLPLSPKVYRVLLALGDGEKHGYAIAEEVARRTNNRITLDVATLYGIIARLTRQKLIIRSKRRSNDRDPDLGFYHLTRLGESVTEAENQRLNDLVRWRR